MAESNFINVKIQVGKTTQNIQMEKGCVFQNKGGSYCIFDDGTLKFQKAGTSEWQNASHINMTNYQWKAFQNVADNDGKSATYSKQDILNAQQKFKQGGFTADMSKDLPAGYKIEHPKMSTADKSVEVDVTNGNAAQSANLKFQVVNKNNNNSNSAVKSSYIGKYGNKVYVQKEGNTVTKKIHYTEGDAVAIYENGVIKEVRMPQGGDYDYGSYYSFKFDKNGRVIESSEGFFNEQYQEATFETSTNLGLVYNKDGTCYKTDKNGNFYHFDSAGRMKEVRCGGKIYNVVDQSEYVLKLQDSSGKVYGTSPSDYEKYKFLNDAADIKMRMDNLTFGVNDALSRFKPKK